MPVVYTVHIYARSSLGFQGEPTHPGTPEGTAEQATARTRTQAVSSALSKDNAGCAYRHRRAAVHVHALLKSAFIQQQLQWQQ
jgi:hypothetical protein